MLQWIQNNIQILIPVIFFGVSGLGWVLKQLKEAQDKKQADQARQRARLEALRTGRIETPPTARSRGQARPTAQAETPRQRLEDLARRRQQEQQQKAVAQRSELEEQLRRRREAIDAQRQRQQQQRQPAPPPRPRTPAPKPAQRPAPQPAQRKEVRPTPTPRRPGERRPVSPLPTMQPVQQTVITDMIEAERIREEVPKAAPIGVGGGRRSVPLTAKGIDLRQAVIMREIFDRPVGLRGPNDANW